MPKLGPGRGYDAAEAGLTPRRGANWQLRQPDTAPYGDRRLTDSTPLHPLRTKLNFLSLPPQRFQVSLILFYSFKVLTYKMYIFHLSFTLLVRYRSLIVIEP